jgi:uncharacterized OB-fold protein
MGDLKPELEYQQFLAEGRFMIQRCRDNGRFLFYPRIAQPATGSTNLEWIEASGKGSVYSTTVVRQRPPAPSYNVALIELAEGPRMMSRVIGVPPEDVTIGMAVAARIIVDDGQPLVVFEPA